jgi:tetratricopeptide (TPR) repeat protein
VRSLTILIILTALLSQGCAVSGGVDSAEKTESIPVEPAYIPQEGLSAKDRFRTALDLLEGGEPESARAELTLYLQDQPNSGIARSLLEQIDTPIAEFFPAEYQEVTLQSGESLSTLAGNYLGSVYLFHSLARYNGIAEPRKLTAGQVIRIPLTEEAVAAFAAGPSGDREAEASSEVSVASEPAPAPELETKSEPEIKSESRPPAADPVIIDSPVVGEMAAAAQSAEESSPLADVESLHREALDAYRAQNLDKAISLWDQALALDPQHENARLYRSQAVELREKLSNIP